MAEKEKKQSTSEKSKSKKPNKFFSFINKVKKFFRDTKAEVKKIVWPVPKAVLKSTGVVLVAIVLLGLFVSGMDLLFMNLLSLVMKVSG
ncbi:preprotein translocase subunit SecE [Scatolibacter rhodanostii]|uniref:preprotein translocase subunit SecE n=1 Tax=Scatolibacter rhodanostii TaxID=2014781 RepID=UPI000C07C61B|nr:preprotein translocase subunit SecE [Scatolibacter rhodanostii]